MLYQPDYQENDKIQKNKEIIIKNIKPDKPIK